jgi:hypothetical protein
MAPTEKDVNFSSYVLYVAPDKLDPHRMCPGSTLALEVVAPFAEDVDVQNVSELLQAGVQLPLWLQGTPCVVDTRLNQPFSGTACIEHLREHAKRGPGELDDMDAPEMQGAVALDWDDTDLSATVSAQTPVKSGKTPKIDESVVQRMLAERSRT